MEVFGKVEMCKIILNMYLINADEGCGIIFMGVTNYFDKDLLPIELSKEFIHMVQKYHGQFIGNQINRIDTTLQLISERRIPDKPTKQQIRLAIEWCKKYEIKINQSCNYLRKGL